MTNSLNHVSLVLNPDVFRFYCGKYSTNEIVPRLTGQGSMEIVTDFRRWWMNTWWCLFIASFPSKEQDIENTSIDDFPTLKQGRYQNLVYYGSKSRRFDPKNRRDLDRRRYCIDNPFLST